MTRYNPFSIEEKWQQEWQKNDAFKASATPDKPKYYVLEMFPYPSGRLHIGHVRNYVIGDVISRYFRVKGYNVLHPMGWDAFGMPAENAAMKNKIHPATWTFANTEAMKQDLSKFGLSYDWSRELTTCTPSYYGLQQQWFNTLFAKGLVYQKESLVNWDPVDHTVLANEQVIDGKGWRSGAPVERRAMKQWFLKITDYADELLESLKTLPNWPERVKLMQENWIGKSEGLQFHFDVEGWNDTLEVYTTRPDTLMGATFCAIAPEHPLAQQVAKTDSKAAAFIQECQALGTALEDIEKAEKKGYQLQQTALHPITGEALPIFIANFVLMSYGTGAIMAVPGHDERDHAFAKAYDLPIKTVISAPKGEETEGIYTGPGTLIHSGLFDGLESDAAKEAVSAWMEKAGKGKKTINYKLKDWGVSRQRYWGCPIPMVQCASCGIVPVPDAQLPVTLPDDVDFSTPGNPLERHATWKKTTCPSCGGAAERITDTMDTFMDSSWYFLHFAQGNDTEAPVGGPEMEYWMKGGVDQYIGGIEHAILHLLYSRFITKVLRDMGYISIDEPFKALLTQGMVINNSYQDKSGNYINPEQVVWQGDVAQHAETGDVLKVNRMEKMSKSKNNGVDPNVLLARYGADTLRLFMMFTAPVEKDLEWNDSGVEGSWRFLGRVWSLSEKVRSFAKAEEGADEVLDLETLSPDAKKAYRALHKAIRKVGHDIEAFHLNTLVAACMELTNVLTALDEKDESAQRVMQKGMKVLAQLLNPVAPHITEEIWALHGGKTLLVNTPWPAFDAAIAQDDEITMVIQINGKLKERLQVPSDISQEEAQARAEDAVKEHLLGLSIVKCIVVPQRLINFVAR